jgi:beta-lactam-binding protein with PASTA domain
VKGKSKADALSLLQAQGFNVTVVEQADVTPVDTVIAQDPKANQKLANGSTVTITVSTGPATTAPPTPTGTPTTSPSP